MGASLLLVAASAALVGSIALFAFGAFMLDRRSKAFDVAHPVGTFTDKVYKKLPADGTGLPILLMFVGAALFVCGGIGMAVWAAR